MAGRDCRGGEGWQNTNTIILVNSVLLYGEAVWWYVSPWRNPPVPDLFVWEMHVWEDPRVKKAFRFGGVAREYFQNLTIFRCGFSIFSDILVGMEGEEREGWLTDSSTGFFIRSSGRSSVHRKAKNACSKQKKIKQTFDTQDNHKKIQKRTVFSLSLSIYIYNKFLAPKKLRFFPYQKTPSQTEKTIEASM